MRDDFLNDEDDDVLRRGAKGAVVLGLRQAVVQLVSLVGAVVLARVLTPAEFGVYGITVFLMHFLVVFGDAGLAAGLVREPDQPDEDDYFAVFTFQQALVAVVAVVGWLLSPLVTGLFAKDVDLGLLWPATLGALLLSSLQTMPVARLERAMRFDLLAGVEIAQAVVFNFFAVAGALAGIGADAMAMALILRAVTGAVLVHVVSPWRIAWLWDWERIRPRLRFGLSFQGAALVSLVRDSLVPVFVGAAIGSAAVGGIFFARMLATYPFMVLYMLQRVLLPLFGHLQSQRGELARAVESTLFAVAALLVPVQATLLVLEEPLVRVVFGEQWLASLGVYRLLWVSTVLEPQLLVALALMNALGHADRTFRLTVATTVSSWLLGVPLLLALGPIGFGVASLALLALKWPMLVEADGEARVDSVSVVAPVWVAAAVGAGVVTVARLVHEPSTWSSLAAYALLSLAVFGAALVLLSPRRTRAALQWLTELAGELARAVR